MTKVAAKSTARYSVYFPWAPLRKVAQRSVGFFKKAVPFQLRRVIARKSSPPSKLSLKKKPNSVCDEDCNNQCFDSEAVSSTGSSRSCCSSVGSNNHSPLLFEKLTARLFSNFCISHSISDENCHEYSDSDSSEFSTSGSYKSYSCSSCCCLSESCKTC